MTARLGHRQEGGLSMGGTVNAIPAVIGTKRGSRCRDFNKPHHGF